ncbi:MAG TPA: galactokinase, partial [Burkholderiales bacterium]|nr:galactokinase [Burkholderiales bacterium]
MKAFEEVYGSQPERVAAAPGRVNLLGEHTDYNEGYVLPTAIRQETRVAMRRSRNAYCTVYSAELDETAQFTLAHPPPQHFATYVYGCLREAATLVDVPQLDIHIASDVPMGVGLSSSAALEVATLRALRALVSLALDDVRLAQIAQRAEIAYAGVNCGILDQMASSLLQPGSMLFLDTRSLEARLVPLPQGTEILVIDSGVARSLASSKYNERRSECEAAARTLGVRALRDITEETTLESLPETLRKRARHVVRENARVLRAVAGVAPEEFGALMSASHRSLRDDYDVSIPALDRLVALLESQDDVHGAKLTGA